MSAVWLPIAIFFPILGGAAVPLIDFRREKTRSGFVLAVALATGLLCGLLLRHPPSGTVALVHLTEHIQIAFSMDGLSAVFTALVAFLWPLAVLYAFEYMKGTRHQNGFYAYYIMSYGLTLGIAFSANLITLYLFCELLTFITLPLITHTGTKAASVAGVKYLVYFVGGATAAFIGIILYSINGGSMAFAPGGMAPAEGPLSASVQNTAYLLMFFGLGCKAAIFPLHDWLPSAGVAPTPVTALLHAVAVVKSGVFAIVRFTCYTFGPAALAGSWAHGIAIITAIFTIVFGAVMAWRETHFKRRLAYSTISNLSYMIFAVLLLNRAGLAAALLHMLFHGVMKIALFFSAGAVAKEAGLTQVTDLNGYGRRMPLTFGVFTLVSLSLIGLAPLAGFMSKWYLAQAALERGDGFAFTGLAAVLVAAFFTALYLLTIVQRAFFPSRTAPAAAAGVGDPGWAMMVPLVTFALATVFLGLWAGSVHSWIDACIGEVFL